MKDKNTLWGAAMQERPSRQTIGWNGWWTRPHSAEHRKKHTPQHWRLIHPSDVALASDNLSLKCDWRIIDDDEGDVTTSQPRSLTMNHRVRRRSTQSCDSFVGQFRLSIQEFANEEGKPGTIPVLLYCLSFIVRRMFRRSRQPLINNPGTSVAAFELLKSAAEQVSKRMKHKDGRPKRSRVEHHSILRNRLVSYRRRRRETHEIIRKEGTAE